MGTELEKKYIMDQLDKGLAKLKLNLVKEAYGDIFMELKANLKQL